MSDVLTHSQRSYCMSRIRGRDTKPEVRLRKELWRLGLRYRLVNSLPGRPDLVLKAKRAVVFVDGCFWHRCPRHSVEPKTNREFWKNKLDTNVRRDRRADRALRKLGWRVVRVWEHQVREDPVLLAMQVLRRIERRS
jgi:DNA mismatch endonuclease, patch repair protein